MNLLSFVTNPIFWRAYKRNLIVGIALLLIAIFGFNVIIGNNPLRRGPNTAAAAENVGPGYCENGWTFNGGDAAKDENWTYTNCGKGGGSSSTGGSSNSGSWRFVYPECDWDSNKVYDVYWHSGTGEYDRRNYHYQEGACGHPPKGTSSASTGTSGSWQFVYPECDWNSKQVYDVYWHSGTSQYDRRNPHYQDGACGYVKNVPTPYPTQAPQRTYQDRQECNGRVLVVKRYWSDNKTEVVQNYGEYRGYCGVPYQTSTNIVTTAPAAPIYQAPPTQPAPIYQPAPAAPIQPTIAQIQAACTSNTTQVFRGGVVTYTAYISTGGTGRVGRVDFRGEQSQSGSGTFSTQYNTSGVKYMMATVSDADPRAGAQVVQCPNITVTEPVNSASVVGVPSQPQPVVYQQPLTYQQPVYQQPTYTQPTYSQTSSTYPQQQVVYQQPQVYSAPAPIYAQAQPAMVNLAPGVNYCPAGQQQQVVGMTVYCLVYTGAQPQTIAYTYSGSGIISQQVINTGSVVPTAPVSQPVQPQVMPNTVPPTPTGTSVQCPSGYTAQAYGTTVYCIASQQQTVVSNSGGIDQPIKEGNVVLAAAGTQPQVATSAASSITELPRTGLPLAAWGVSALLPLGLKMRKGKKADDREVSVNSIWMNRQMSKD